MLKSVTTTEVSLSHLLLEIHWQKYRLNADLDQAGLIPESHCWYRKDRGTIDMIFPARQLQIFFWPFLPCCGVTYKDSVSETAVCPIFILNNIVTALKGTHF